MYYALERMEYSMPDQSDVTAEGGTHGREPRPGRPADRRSTGDVEPAADVLAAAVGTARPVGAHGPVGTADPLGGAGAPPGPTGHGLANPWVVLGVTTLSVFAVFLDTTILFVAFPDLVATFPDVSRSSLSWVLNAYTIVFAAGLVPAGRIADRVGRRRCFLIAVAVFTLASALCGVAPNPELLVAARVLQALGAALMVPSSLALVLQTFPAPRVPVALAVWGAVGAVAGAVGPSLGALVIDGSSWRWAFYLNVPVGIVALVAGLRVLPEGRESRPGPIPDPVGALVLVGGMALVALGVVQADAWGFGSSSTLGAVAAGAALLALFVWRCSRVAAPVFDLTLFRTWNYRWANAATATFYVGFTASFFANFQFLESVWGYSLVTAGLAMTPGPLVVAVLAPFMGRIAAARGQRRLLVPGGLVTAAGALWLLTAAGGEAHWLAHWLPGSILTGVGVALCLPQLSSAALQGLPPDRFGSGSAGNQAIRNLASTLAVSLAVTLIGVPLTQSEAIAGFQRVWWVAVASGLATTLLSLPLRRAAPRPTVAGVAPASPAAPDEATAVAGGTAAPVPAAVTASPAPAADGLDGFSPHPQVTVAD
jgi:EmrB/QacA subfamily drug resistance transporter